MAVVTDRSSNPPSYPNGGTFGELINWHLEWGTRPGCDTRDAKGNTPWIISNFAILVCGNDVNDRSARKNIDNWRNGRLPDPKNESHRIANIFLEFFGSDGNLSRWQADLEEALDRARAEQSARIARRPLTQSPTLNSRRQGLLIESDSSAQPPSFSSNTTLSQLTAAEIEFVVEVRRSGFFQNAITNGVSEDYLQMLFSKMAEWRTPIERAEEEGLILLLESHIEYQQEFALESLLSIKNLSSLSVDRIIEFIFTQARGSISYEIERFFESELNEDRKTSVAYALLQTDNADARLESFAYLAEKSKINRQEAVALLNDRSLKLRRAALKYCRKKNYIDSESRLFLLQNLPNEDKVIANLCAEILLECDDNEIMSRLDRIQRYALQSILAGHSSMWPLLISYIAKANWSSVEFLLPLLREIAKSSDRSIQNVTLAVIPRGREDYIYDLITQLKNNNEIDSVRAAYRLGYAENKSEAAVTALDLASSQHSSQQVRYMANLALQRLNGNEAVKGTNPNSLEFTQGYYPFHKAGAIVGNKLGLDIKPILNLMTYSARFNADFYIKSLHYLDQYEKINGGEILDIYGSCCCNYKSEITILTTGPEAIECLDSIKKFVEDGMI